jgi:signal peptidase II
VVVTAEPSAQQPSSKRRKRALPVLICAAVGILVLDQLAKWWVVTNLPEGVPVPVIGEFLQWQFVRNPGAAFSFASGATWIFTIIAITVGVVILWLSRRIGSYSWALFLGLLLGGTLGNLSDRLFRTPGFPQGHVVDFISTPWMMPAIYNIADMAIVSSMGLFIVVTILGISLDGSRQARVRHRAATENTDGN